MSSAILTRSGGTPAAAPRRARFARRLPSDIRRIVLADEEALFRIGLRDAITDLFPKADVLEVSSFAPLVAALEDGGCDLVLMDLGLPGLHGYLSLLVLGQRFPETRFIAISGIDAPLVSRRAVAFGLAGFVSKRSSRDKIAQALSSTLRRSARISRGLAPAEKRLIEGLRRLTPAELTLFALLPDNASHRQLMQALGIALPTVKTHMSRILQKLSLRNRTEAAVIANRIANLTAPTLCIESVRGGPPAPAATNGT